MNTITKKDIVKRISYSTGERQKIIKRVIDELLEHITEALIRGERVELRKFGIFRISWMEDNSMWDLNTGEKVKIPSHKAAKFKSGKFLFKRLNKK